MRRVFLPVFMVLLIASAGMVGAAETAVSAPEPSPGAPAVGAPAVEAPAVAVQAVEKKETAGTCATPAPLFATTVVDIDPVEDPSSLHCNCNDDPDCKRICGDRGGSCFIGPLCDNWPDFRGKCKCNAKPVGIQAAD